MPFTRDEQHNHEEGSFEYHLTREGGHSHRRIIHAADATGAAIFNTLLAQARRRPNIELLSQRVAVDLITERKLGLPSKRCLGAYVLNRESGEVDTFRARFSVLASGGASKVYLYTSNPDGNSGDGIAMAWRAGCRVGNLSSTSSIRPACTTRRPRVSSSPRHCAAKAPCSACPMASVSCRASTRVANWRPGTSWPAPSTMK